MYVRDAKNRDEVWLLDHIEELGLDGTAFRSRDYVIAVDEETGDRAGFGRIRVHRGDEEVCELTSIGVLPVWRGQGVGAHVIERLVEYAGDEGFEEVYALTGETSYLAQFGFEAIDPATLPAALRDRLADKREGVDPDAAPMVLSAPEFRMPPRLRESFKSASRDDDDDGGTKDSPEDFGIDPDEATYKYST